MMFYMENFHILHVDVGLDKESFIWYLPVIREAHWSVVWELLTTDAALAVTVMGSFHGLPVVFSSIIDDHGQYEVHAFTGALRKEHPVGDTTLVDVVFIMQFSSGRDGGISVVHKRLEAWNVGDGY